MQALTRSFTILFALMATVSAVAPCSQGACTEADDFGSFIQSNLQVEPQHFQQHQPHEKKDISLAEAERAAHTASRDEAMRKMMLLEARLDNMEKKNSLLAATVESQAKEIALLNSALSVTKMNGTTQLRIKTQAVFVENVEVNGANLHVYTSGQYSNDNGKGNLIVGVGHTFSEARNSFVAGEGNTIADRSCSVTGGFGNNAGAKFSSVMGGKYNEATGPWYSTVAGGQYNKAMAITGAPNAEAPSVFGGYENAAVGTNAAVFGGFENLAYGSQASALGGHSNNAWAERGTVVGGSDNTAWGTDAAVFGGKHNEAEGNGGIAPLGCFEDNMDFHGNDVVRETAPTANDCQIKCAENSRCQYFTWKSDGTNYCYLKTSKSNRKATSRSVSGPRVCEHFGHKFGSDR